jgi:beta-ribofuranosylaminobenzene 5'-phosphate synthase
MTPRSGVQSRVLVKAFARLHFSLVNLSTSGHRVNGGAGAMIDPPFFEVEITPSLNLEVEPATFFAEASDIILRLKARSQMRLRVTCHSHMKWHYGLGFHTQMRLAIATAIALSQGITIDPDALASQLARGGTSGIGALGFWHGGLLFDGGRERTEVSESLLPSAAISKPKSSPLLHWRRSLPFIPVVAQARNWDLVYGAAERSLFERLTPIPPSEANECARIVFQDMQSAVVAADFDTFCASIIELGKTGFKRRERQFRGVEAIEIDRILTSAGLRGVGMSSWGPTWFGFTTEPMAAQRAVATLLNSGRFEGAWVASFAPGAQVNFGNGPVQSVLSASTSRVSGS